MCILFAAWRYSSQSPGIACFASRKLRASQRTKEIEIRTNLERPARVPMWIAGISICLLTASGIVAIVRSIPTSYANIPDKGAASEHRRAPSAFKDAHAKDPQAHLAAARATINGRTRVRCPECGVIESVAQIERSRVGRREDAADVKVAGVVSGDASGSAIAAPVAAGKRYEMLVRFRDGSATVFNEATPRSWPSGSRVIVIGGSNPSNN